MTTYLMDESTGEIDADQNWFDKLTKLHGDNSRRDWAFNLLSETDDQGVLSGKISGNNLETGRSEAATIAELAEK